MSNGLRCSTRDGAKTWDRIDIRSDTMLLDCAIANDGSVYYLRGVERRNLASGPAEPLFRYAFQLVRLVPAQGRWDEECDELPVGVAGIKIYIDGWSVWIGVNDPEKYWHGPNRLGRWIGSGQFEVVDHQFPAIHSVSFNGSAITMLCGGSGGSSDFHWKMGGGSPPATFYVYRSEDVGRSWRCETSPIGMDRPAALLGDHVWGIGLGNRLYHKRVHV